MIRALVLICLVLFAPLADAGESYPRHALAQGEILRGRFTQERHLQGFAAPLRSEGQFVLAPDRGLIWRTEKPFAVNTVITPAGLAQDVNGNQTVNLSAAKMPFFSRLYQMLSGALAGDWAALEEDFTITRQSDGHSWSLVLLPKRPDNLAMPFRSIAVAGKRFVHEVTLTKPDGDFDKLVFLQQAASSEPLSADEAAAFASLSQ